MRDLDKLGGDPRFKDALWEIAKLHERKQYDYGTDEDPFANVRSSVEFGIPPWVGACIREHDKTVRIQSFLRRGELKNEPIEDAFMDKAVYSLIALILYREAHEA